MKTETETPAGPDGTVRHWRGEIDRAGRAERDWMGRADKVVERYRAEKRQSGRRQVNILWANTEILKPAVYSQTPAPDVRRRYLDDDPVGREAALVLERALSYLLDDDGFDRAMEAVRDDMLLPGRGVARIVYEPVIAKRALERVDGADGPPVFLLDGRPVEPDGFDGEAAWAEEVTDERVRCRHVFWKDYREQPARCWDEVGWIAFRHALARGELVERFGAIGRDIPLEGAVRSYDGRDRAGAAPEAAKRAVLWEIWDKPSRKRIVIADGFDRVVEETADPLGLAGFFPVPEPLYAVKTSDSRVPIPEFTLYQDQALELDELATRKRHLIAALRARGVYAGVLGEIERLLTEAGENEMIPVKDWDQFRDKGGLAAAIEWLPIERIAQVIVSLNGHMAQLKAEIFEITGLSDIVRGSTQASETATAQRLKGSFGTMRMQPRQRPMQRFVRDALRLKAEVIAEHFRPETLARMTGRPVPPAVASLLRDERLRGFRIDIETESTVQPDAEAERRNAVEFLTAATGFFTGIAPLIGAAPQSAPMFLEMFRTAARSFKPGRRLEEVIGRTSDALIRQAEAAAAAPPPGPAEGGPR
ncbi:MAG: hypothetical protein OXP07_11225 [Defluviicoccus sp.]|nr:hypothetical protein [Defluviicoccus sp.]